MLQILGLAFLIFVADLPWLILTQPYVSGMVRGIQGGTNVTLRILPAAIVYLALAWLATVPRSPTEAFLLGLCTYAVYDFTNLATLVNYDLRFAVADTFWGGILFTFIWFVSDRLGLRK
jgi:uncharacterized membrane protein